MDSLTEQDHFVTVEALARKEGQELAIPRGRLLIAACQSGSQLAEKVVKRYRALLNHMGSRESILDLLNIDKRFSDSETCVRLEEHVSGSDAFLFQAPFDPTREFTIDQNYMAFLIATRALREHGARHITGVMPYLAYARQDKPTKFTREPTTARLMADLSITAGLDRLIVWDPHCNQIRGFYGAMPVNMLESLTLFIHEFRNYKGRDDVIAVAPDAGASKFVTHFGRALDLTCAIASKYRPEPETVVISEIIGDFRRKRIAIILDDMISGGGTIDALIRKLVEEKNIQEIYLGVSHNLCVGKAYERLKALHQNFGLKQVIITNSIPQTKQFMLLPFVTVRCLSEFLVKTINRIHHERSVSQVFYRPGHERVLELDL
jgi:ribose-phosphate pyrophosphokinase